MIQIKDFLTYYFIIILDAHMEYHMHNLFCNILSFLQLLLQKNSPYYYYVVRVLILQTNHQSITQYPIYLKEIQK